MKLEEVKLQIKSLITLIEMVLVQKQEVFFRANPVINRPTLSFRISSFHRLLILGL